MLEFTPAGKFLKVYAWGIRNCVGEAINPTTGQLWCSTNERDGLGNNLVPDYITHIQEGGFYGWPWWYMGGHQDPRHVGKHPELQSKVITPDILLNPHFASLEMTFYTGSQFPAEFKGDGFACEHGSWNRAAARRLRSHPPAHAQRPRHRRVRGLPHRICNSGWQRLGPSRGRSAGARWIAVHLGRRLALHLACELCRKVSKSITDRS